MSATPTHEERLQINYSTVGVAVMQAIYSDDYLSIGGTESTDELARLAGVTARSRVLDIGCGVGGPALHLAASIGCSVTGIDLVATSVDLAQQQAERRGLTGLAAFHQGDATALPFADNSFDVVLGQDAWCHVPDKPALLAEAHRVLGPRGVMTFTDWLAGDGASPAERAAALDAALSSTAATADGYLTMLDNAGFTPVRHLDISKTFVRQYQEICARLDANRAMLIDRFGDRVYDIVAAINDEVLRGFERGAITGGRFVAKTSSGHSVVGAAGLE